MTIRQAQPYDWPEVVRMARAFAATDHGRWMRVEEMQLSQMFINGLDQPSVLCLVAEKGIGELRGVLVAETYRSVFCLDTVGEVMALWVDPSERSGRLALGLIGVFHEWADAKNLTLTKLSAHYKARRRSRTLQRLGYEPLEVALYRRVEG